MLELGTTMHFYNYQIFEDTTRLLSIGKKCLLALAMSRTQSNPLHKDRYAIVWTNLLYPA